MSGKELVELCKSNKKKKDLFWTADVYGLGKYLRKYAYFPEYLPLNAYLSHGIPNYDQPAPHELNNKAPVMFYYSSRLTKEFKKQSKKSCYTVVSPNVFYRRRFKIEKEPTATGTIAFPCHSTPEMDDLTDYNEYCAKLKSLSGEFTPVSVCLHYHDINKGLHKIFMDHGFEVLTVGSPYHSDFIERFYNILKKFKYVTSNEVGSYAYYAVEMNIPFLLFGNPIQLFNRGDVNVEKGYYNTSINLKSSKQTAKALEIFSTFNGQVTQAQKEFVEKELGVNDSISRFKAGIILYKAYLKHLSEKVRMKFMFYFQRSFLLKKDM